MDKSLNSTVFAAMNASKDNVTRISLLTKKVKEILPAISDNLNL